MGPRRTAETTREINDLMRTSLDDGGASRFPFFCECGRAGCFAPVWLSASEYDAARAAGARLLAGADAPVAA